MLTTLGAGVLPEPIRRTPWERSMVCQTEVASLMPTAENVSFFGMHIARTTMREAVTRVLGWCAAARGGSCRYVVTPNTDHVVLFQGRNDFRDAYDKASLVLADGTPLVWVSRLLGQQLPERVAGSDLIPALFATTTSTLRVFLLGAAPGVAEQAARQIENQWPNVAVVGTYSPPIGFDNNAVENRRAIAEVNAVPHDLLIVGLGAPRQELWVAKHHKELSAKVAICAGATIDFLAGRRQRSPMWMRQAGLEWLHRVCSEPRRLAGRYLRDAFVFPQLLWQEWRRSTM